uniref:3Beta_HSD domain-containing protein n=1 Tax=Rhabditophanes sp. KR3021 TaxID=114890 RepID=A0AC35TK61_9BILA
MEGINKVCIFGYDSTLGFHLAKELQETYPDIFINYWTLNKLDDSADQRENIFWGVESVDDALHDCKIAYNVLDCRDWSLATNKETLKYVNEDIPKLLLQKCEDKNDIALIHVSSTLVQLSNKWPNIYLKEKYEMDLEANDLPHKDYCKSKLNCENMLIKHASSVPHLILRCTTLYGEMDLGSAVTDAKKCLLKHKKLPYFNEDNGVCQMTYAGNAASAVIKCSEKLIKEISNKNMNEKSISGEIIIISDHTPVINLRKAVLNPLLEENDNCLESFYAPLTGVLFLYFWLMVAFFVKILPLKNETKKVMPDYDYFLLHYYNWTFYNTYKLDHIIKWKPKYSYEESIALSTDYYKDNADIENFKFSWENNYAK